jgi:hypothetical protein
MISKKKISVFASGIKDASWKHSDGNNEPKADHR